jgi:hypothetical protein
MAAKAPELQRIYDYVDKHKEETTALHELYSFVILLFKLAYFGSPEFTLGVNEKLKGEEDESLLRVLHTWVIQPRDGQGRTEVVNSLRDLDEYINDILFPDEDQILGSVILSRLRGGTPGK